jgi:predicted sugar kinase
MIKIRVTGEQLRLQAALDAENNELRAALKTLADEATQLRDRVAHLAAAHSGLYHTCAALADAQATRNLVARDAMLEQIAANWADMRGRGTVH